MAKHWGLSHWPTPKFQVGDIVSYGADWNRKEGRITEDRGAYGNPLRHIYEIEVVFDEWNTVRTEVPEDSLTLQTASKVSR